MLFYLNSLIILEEENSSSNSFNEPSRSSIFKKSSLSLQERCQTNRKKRKKSIHSLSENINPLIDLVNEEFIGKKKNCRRKSCQCSKCGPIASFERISFGISLPIKKIWLENLEKDAEKLKNKKKTIISPFLSKFHQIN